MLKIILILAVLIPAGLFLLLLVGELLSKLLDPLKAGHVSKKSGKQSQHEAPVHHYYHHK